MSSECDVDHDERRAMGMEGCYRCWAVLQSAAEAEAIKAKRGAGHIEHRKGAAGELTAYVGQSRIRVADVANMYEAALQEFVVGRMRLAWPELSMRELSAAVRYWREHESEIQGVIARDEVALVHVERGAK